VLSAIVQDDRALTQEVIDRKARVRHLVERLSTHLAQRLLTDEPNRVVVFRVEADIINQINRLYYITRQIAKVFVRDMGNENVGQS